jgi:transposase
MALELGDKKWRLAFGDGSRTRQVSIPGGDLAALGEAQAKAKQRWGLPAATAVVSCYEAGRYGFWLHRCLESRGVQNVVVDSASIMVDRRARRAKTDRLDADSLVQQLRRWHGGERQVWRVVQVPSAAAEDQRRPLRELERLQRERTQQSNRLRGLLRLHGLDLKVGRAFAERLAELRQWDGQPLPPRLVAELLREYERWELVNNQLLALAKERVAEARAGQTTAAQQVRQLARLLGVGEHGAWILASEFFAWRGFKNRKEVGALAGLTGTPYNSGKLVREQGISKAGNRRVRKLMVELAWCWLRYQPQSAVAKWFWARFGEGSGRTRRVGIVALARKLLVAFWRWLAQGTLPEGAVLKAAPATETAVSGRYVLQPATGRGAAR